MRDSGQRKLIYSSQNHCTSTHVSRIMLDNVCEESEAVLPNSENWKPKIRLNVANEVVHKKLKQHSIYINQEK